MPTLSACRLGRLAAQSRPRQFAMQLSERCGQLRHIGGGEDVRHTELQRGRSVFTGALRATSGSLAESEARVRTNRRRLTCRERCDSDRSRHCQGEPFNA